MGAAISYKSIHFDSYIVDAIVSTVETPISHGLSRTPEDGLIINLQPGAKVYRGSTAWSSSLVYLQADQVCRVRVMLI